VSSYIGIYGRQGTQGPARWGLAVLLAAATWSSAEGSATRPAVQSAPDPPAMIAPAPLDTVLDLPPDLTVRVGDPDGDDLGVAFYGRRRPAPAGPDFTLVELPDTQYYTSSLVGGSPAIFLAQTGWIAANRAVRNIAYVAHVGDIVQSGENGGNQVEWIVADSAMRVLEDPAATGLPEGIPFGVSAGNHDIGPGGNPAFNEYFGVSRFAGRSYYGGHFGTDNNNWFELFSASGLDFIVIGIGLAWTLDPAVLLWANGLLTTHSNRRAIVVSHWILDPGPPVTFCDIGQQIYDALKGHANLIMMICGHNVNEARRADTCNGHTIHTVMANYQNWAHGGDGWLRIMEFSPANSQIRMRTYSPWLGRFETDADSSSQFTLDCDLSAEQDDFHLIGTLDGVPAGSTVSIPWPGLQRDQQYEWYVTASDGSSTVTGPVWQFTVPNNAATTGAGEGPAGPFALDPVAPNPTRGPSRFGIALPEAGRIRLDILDVAGRHVATLADGFEPAGRREFAWDGTTGRGRAVAGLYFARLHVTDRVRTRRFVVTP